MLNRGTPASQRVFDFANTAGGGTLFFNTGANSAVSNIRDHGYDQLESGYDANWMSDLRLSCFYTRHDCAGPLQIQLSRSENCFTAEITPTGVTLRQSTIAKSSDADTGKDFDPGTVTWSETKTLPGFAPDRPVHVEFTNVDYRVTVTIDGVPVIVHDYDPNLPAWWKCSVARRAGGSIRPAGDSRRGSAANLPNRASGAFARYLLRQQRPIPRLPGSPARPILGKPGNPVHLGSQEYFVLGDNSQISGDARYWGLSGATAARGDAVC